jgi:glycosyltransferase involved in cell wall biosynthesis
MADVPLRVFVAHPSALLTDHRPHGDGLVAFGFLRELAARGHELHVAAQAVDLRDPPVPGLHVHRLAEGGAPGDKLRFMAGMRRLLGRLQRRRPFDLVHQLNPVDVGLSLAIAGVRLPVVLGPYVPDWPPTGPGADAVVSPPVLRLKRVLRAAQQRRAAMVLLSTPAAAARLEGSWPGRLRVREIPPGIDSTLWAPAPAAPPRDDAEDVLFLANLQVRKGIFVALDAFDRVAAERPSARLLVAGEGPEAAAVRRLVAASPARERIVLLGGVTREQALPAMQACSVFCAPSFAEPFGMSALEAMACARPVVATRAGGLQHLIDERGGRVVAPGDAPALAAALAEVLSAPALRVAMGRHNRRVVQQRYDWSPVVDRLEEAYSEVLWRSR